MAVADLRRRVRKRRHQPGVVLHGPRGVGKLALARTYAQAVLCEAPSTTGSACGHCPRCEAFASNGERSVAASEPNDFGFIPLDAGHPDIEAKTHGLLRLLAGGSLADHHVIVINNADAERFQSRVFDNLLNALENPRAPRTFVLLATEISKIRAAGLSRCTHHHLKPLTTSEAREHLGALLAAQGTGCDEAFLEALVAGAAGRVGRLSDYARRLANLPAVTLQAVHVQFGDHRVDAAISLWRAMLTGDISAATSAGAETSLRYLRQILATLEVPGDRQPWHDAALRLYEDRLTLLRDDFQSHATSRGINSAILWADLAHLWLSDGLSDAVGLSGAILDTCRRLVAGTRSSDNG